jgi:hypothetical protein
MEANILRQIYRNTVDTNIYWRSGLINPDVEKYVELLEANQNASDQHVVALETQIISLKSQIRALTYDARVDKQEHTNLIESNKLLDSMNKTMMQEIQRLNEIEGFSKREQMHHAIADQQAALVRENLELKVRIEDLDNECKNWKERYSKASKQADMYLLESNRFSQKLNAATLKHDKEIRELKKQHVAPPTGTGSTGRQ